MAENRGKQFESIIRSAFAAVSNTTVVRLQDPTTGFLGNANTCDFIIYNYPNQYFIECKTIHGNTFPLSNISKHQWEGLSEVAPIKGVIAGVICWWVDKDVTMFLPIRELKKLKAEGKKSVRFDDRNNKFVHLVGTKKRVFFNYNLKDFIERTKQWK